MNAGNYSTGESQCATPKQIVLAEAVQECRNITAEITNRITPIKEKLFGSEPQNTCDACNPSQCISDDVRILSNELSEILRVVTSIQEKL